MFSPMLTARICLGFMAAMFMLAAGPTTGAYAGGPDLIHYQGFLRDDSGVPVTTSVNLAFRVHDAETGETSLWTENHPNITPVDGVFSVVLGSVEPLPADLFDGSERWLETFVGGLPLSPRRQFLSTPYAMRAAVADVALSGGGSDSDWIIDGDNVYRDSGSVGIGTSTPEADLHVSGGNGSASLRIEADQNNSGEANQPHIALSQDGGIISAELGYFDSENDFTIRNNDTGSGETLQMQFRSASRNLTIDGDVEIGGGELDADATSESIVIRGQSDTWWMGVQNEATESESDFFLSRSGSSEDGTLHVENDGDVGIGTTSPESKLSVGGRLDADTFRADSDLGESATPENGGVYRDNVVYAWAHINGAGTILDGFGIDSVTHLGVGHWEVDFKTQLSGLSVTVQPNSVNDVVVAGVNTSGSSADVWQRLFVPGNHNFQLVNYGFYIQVVGRPQ